MSADRDLSRRYDRIRAGAASWYDEKPTEYFRYHGPRAFFIDGAVCGATFAMQLTDAEWEAERAKAARAISDTGWDVDWQDVTPGMQADFKNEADAAMRALGYTKISESGGIR